MIQERNSLWRNRGKTRHLCPSKCESRDNFRDCRSRPQKTNTWALSRVPRHANRDNLLLCTYLARIFEKKKWLRVKKWWTALKIRKNNSKYNLGHKATRFGSWMWGHLSPREHRPNRLKNKQYCLLSLDELLLVVGTAVVDVGIVLFDLLFIVLMLL